MGVDGDLYRVVLVLHILAAIVGFGGMFVASFYGAEGARLPGREGLVVSETTLKVTGQVPTMAVYAVPVLGILLVLLSDDEWKFSHLWVILSFLLYVGLIVLAVAVQVPNLRRMISLRSGAEGVKATEMEARARKAGIVGGIVNLLWIAILVLMVFKPGV